VTFNIDAGSEVTLLQTVTGVCLELKVKKTATVYHCVLIE